MYDFCEGSNQQNTVNHVRNTCIKYKFIPTIHFVTPWHCTCCEKVHFSSQNLCKPPKTPRYLDASCFGCMTAQPIFFEMFYVENLNASHPKPTTEKYNTVQMSGVIETRKIRRQLGAPTAGSKLPAGRWQHI